MLPLGRFTTGAKRQPLASLTYLMMVSLLSFDKLRLGGRRDGIAPPYVFQGFGQRLLFYLAVRVPRVSGENKLVVIALVSQNLRHALVGHDPIVHVVAHRIGMEQVAIANLHPDA